MTTEQAILATLAYHDIFDFPLTIEETHKYLINYQTPPKALEKNVNTLLGQHKIGEMRGFYFLKKRKSIISTRLKRQKYSIPKHKKAQFFARILKFIPTIKLVAISGALAMDNSHKDDDIDLVIVTQKDTLWTTRFFANTLLFPLKRKPLANRLITYHSSLITNNKACLNIFIDETDLKIKPQNLYTAHEICQMKVLWDRDKTYSHFIKANSWIYKFLPNWKMENQWQMENGKWKMENRGTPRKDSSLITHHSSLAEIFLKKFQLWYMRPKITTERIGDTQLFFHPQNTQDWVLKEYQKKIKKIRIDNYRLKY